MRHRLLCVSVLIALFTFIIIYCFDILKPTKEIDYAVYSDPDVPLPMLFILNLERTPQRLDNITKECAKAGIAMTRFDAVDGKSDLITLPPTEKKWISPLAGLHDRGKDLPGELGCAASHLKLLAMGEEEGLGTMLIGEDDFLFLPHAKQKMQGALNYLKKLNPEWSMLSFPYYDDKWSPESSLSEPVAKSIDWLNTGGVLYAVSPSGRRIILDEVTENGLHCPIDMLYTKLNSNNPSFTLFRGPSGVIKLRDTPSTIRSFDRICEEEWCNKEDREGRKVNRDGWFV